MSMTPPLKIRVSTVRFCPWAPIKQGISMRDAVRPIRSTVRFLYIQDSAELASDEAIGSGSRLPCYESRRRWFGGGIRKLGGAVCSGSSGCGDLHHHGHETSNGPRERETSVEAKMNKEPLATALWVMATVEWSGETVFGTPCCPYCKALRTRGHTPGCDLNEALRECYSGERLPDYTAMQGSEPDWLTRMLEKLFGSKA